MKALIGLAFVGAMVAMTPAYAWRDTAFTDIDRAAPFKDTIWTDLDRASPVKDDVWTDINRAAGVRAPDKDDGALTGE